MTETTPGEPQKSILVTGGAGYVGSGLLVTLLNEGYRVICADDLYFGGGSLLSIWHHPNFRFVKCNITDYEKVDEILSSTRPYGVVHLAAVVGDPACSREPERAREVNGVASRRLIDACIRHRVERFIFASTCSNYGRMKDPESYVDETSPLAPVSLYAELKVEFENFLLNEIEREEWFAPTSLRFATVYGVSPRMRFDLTVNEFTKELALGHELVVFGEQFWRPYCHVADFSRAFLRVLESKKSKVAYNVFNVGSTEENYTKQMIVEELSRQIPGSRIKYVERQEDPRDYRVNSDKIRNELGFEISFRVPDGIREVRRLVEEKLVLNTEAAIYYNIPHAVDNSADSD